MSEAGVQTGLQTSARRLADLQDIIRDLRLVVTRCDMMQRPDFDESVKAAIWDGLVVAYYRSFASGRSGLGSQERRRLHTSHVERLGPVHQRTHAVVTAERHRQVAHRDDRTDDLATTGELNAESIKSLSLSLIDGLMIMASAEQDRLDERTRKRLGTN